MESNYRNLIQQLYDRIELALESVDPDLVECEQTLGSLVLTLSDRSKCILSAQPSVQQLWLALASRGTAYHFNYDQTKNQWLDDKGLGVEVVSLLEKLLKETTGLEISL
jgi:iron donor protein CyaY